MQKHKFELKEATQIGASLVREKLANNQLALISLGTGGGKTYISIHAIGSVIPDAHLVLITPLSKTRDGDWQASIDAYNEVMHTELTMEIFNYEKLDNTKFVQTVEKSMQASKKPIALVMDEAHRIKNATGVRAKACLKLAAIDTVVAKLLVTASPVSNSYLDSITYLIMAGFYKNKTDFTNQHVEEWDEYHRPKVRNAQKQVDKHLFLNWQQIEAELESFVVNFDVDDLKPEVIKHHIDFELDDDEYKEYRQIMKDYRNGEYPHIQAARKAMFDFTASHSEQKLQQVSKILAQTKRPVIIFYQYNAVLHQLLDYLHEHHPSYDVVQMNGVVNNKKKFTGNEPKKKKTIALVQYKAGAEGWNAQYSDTTIFFEPNYSYEQFQQAAGRNVRAYMDHGVTHWELGLSRTIEDAVWATLDNKQSFSDSLLKAMMNGYKITKPSNDQSSTQANSSSENIQSVPLLSVNLQLIMTESEMNKLAQYIQENQIGTIKQAKVDTMTA